MARITVSTTQLGALGGMLRRFARAVGRLALIGGAGAVAIALLLARGGLSAGEAVVTLLLLAPPAILFFFAQGIRAVAALPERLRRVPGEGQERLAELTRIAADARTARIRGLPLLAWRLRGTLGSFRDVAGVALPLRVFTPAFLGATAVAALLCVVLAGAGLIALVLLASG